MSETTVTKISSKGQIVIPKPLREELSISNSDEFLIYGERDTIILKKIKKPSLKKRFQDLNERLSTEMSKKGVKRKDIEQAISRIRKGD